MLTRVSARGTARCSRGAGLCGALCVWPPCGQGAARRSDRSYNAAHRPDPNVADGALDGGHIIGELKLTDQMTAEATNIGRRGARVAFGNSRPDLRKQVLGQVGLGQNFARCKGELDFALSQPSRGNFA